MWWRRHSSLWPCSLHPGRIIRDTDTPLRSTENLLRNSRTLSKTPSTLQEKHAQDNKIIEDNRSIGNFHVDYRKWKEELERRMVEDPYKLLFGASEQRLKGLGFGMGWMEMGMGWMEKDAAGRVKATDTKIKEQTEMPKVSRFERHMPPSSAPTCESKTYPRKVKFNTEDSFTKRVPFKLGRSESSTGVASPSDPRRLYNECEHVAKNDDGTRRTYQLGGHDVSAETFAKFTEWQNMQQAMTEETEARKGLEEEEAGLVNEQEAVARETDFISEFLNESPSTRAKEAKGSSANRGLSDEKDWKQTVLDRRAGNTSKPRTRAEFTSTIRARQRRFAALHNNMPTKIRVEPSEKNTSTVAESDVISDIKASAASANIMDTQAQLPKARFWHYMSEQDQLLDDIAKGLSTSNTVAQEESFIQLDKSKHQRTGNEKFTNPTLTRPTSEVLSQLPKDDIDFLSAADVRAAMGTKKAQEEATKSRTELEKDFQEAHAKDTQIDLMVESKIVNDKYIRRLERELKAKQEAKQEIKSAAQETGSSESILEISFNSLTKLIQDRGECFTKYLWSDPVGADRSTKRSWDPMLVDIVQTLRQNRDSLREISQDLENDIPSTKHLLKGLMDSESRAIGSVVSLAKYHDISELAVGAESRKKHDDVVGSLKLVDYQPKMLKQMEQAFQAIDSMRTVKVSLDIQERLQIAETVLKGNAKSTRTMWRASLRAPIIDRSEVLRQILIHHMRAVSDFQSSLLEVVQTVMRRLDVLRMQEEQSLLGRANFSGTMSDTRTVESTTSDNLDKTVAANQKLEEEIQAQKDAMRGLADDGYKCASKPIPAVVSTPTPPKKKTLDELKPLANSLFRPFGLQLESLGKEEENMAEERNSEAQKQKEKLAKNAKLVTEASRVYENASGPIVAEVAAKETEEIDEGWPAISHSAPKAATSNPVANDRVAAKDNEPPTLVAKAIKLFLREPGVDILESKDAASTITSASADKLDTFTLEEQNQDNVKIGPTTSPSSTKRVLGAPTIDLEPLQTQLEEPVVKPAPTPYISLAANVPETVREPPPAAPITYKIFTYNPSTDELSITTTTSTAQSDHHNAVPLPEALLVLDHPGKFTPHLPDGYEITRMKNDMLVLRKSNSATKLQTKTVKFAPTASESVYDLPTSTPDFATKAINDRNTKDWQAQYSTLSHCIIKDDGNWDGTPIPNLTEELRQRGSTTAKMKDIRSLERDLKRDLRRRRSAGLMKTVVWAGAGCYALGVLGELLA